MNYRVLTLLALLCAAGCATTVPGRAPGDASSPVPVERRGDLGRAGEALLIQGANERRAGDYGAASATLERALRIEPSAPALWLELARVRLLQGDFRQAEQLARKAGSLAPADSVVASEAQWMIEEARRKGAL